MPGRRGWQDWIPASGEGRALVELKGRVGGKSGGRMYRRRGVSAKIKERRKSAIWVPYSSFAQDSYPATDGDGIQLSTVGALTTMLALNPIESFQNSAGPELGQVSHVAFNAEPHLMRFDGDIWCYLPKVVDYADVNSNTFRLVGKPYYVWWCWRFLQVTAEETIATANVNDIFNNGAEGYFAFSDRKSNAILDWGHAILERDIRAPAIYVETASPNDHFGGSYALQWAQNMPRVKIPFPRVPKTGFRMPKERSLVLQVGWRNNGGIIDYTDGVNSWGDADSTGGGVPNLFMMFRVLYAMQAR